VKISKLNEVCFAISVHAAFRRSAVFYLFNYFGYLADLVSFHLGGCCAKFIP
jgi:hypothetical protein